MPHKKLWVNDSICKLDIRKTK